MLRRLHKKQQQQQPNKQKQNNKKHRHLLVKNGIFFQTRYKINANTYQTPTREIVFIQNGFLQ